MVNIFDSGELENECLILSEAFANFSDNMILGREVDAGAEGDGEDGVSVLNVDCWC